MLTNNGEILNKHIPDPIRGVSIGQPNDRHNRKSAARGPS